MNPYLKQYQQTEIKTSSPEKLLIMLYDGAIQFLNKAKIGISNKNIEETHNNIIAAQKIISEFMNSLDLKIGGEVAKNLYSLYEYLNYRLIQANIKKDIDMVDEVLNHLKDLKQTWEQAIKIASREKIEQENADENEEESVKSA